MARTIRKPKCGSCGEEAKQLSESPRAVFTAFGTRITAGTLCPSCRRKNLQHMDYAVRHGYITR